MNTFKLYFLLIPLVVVLGDQQMIESCISTLIKHVFREDEIIYVVTDSHDNYFVPHSITNPLIVINPFETVHQMNNGYGTNWIIHAESEISLVSIMDHLSSSTIWNRGFAGKSRYVLVMPPTNLNATFPILWDYDILKIIVAIHNCTSVKFYTCNTHERSNCGRTPVVINSETCSTNITSIQFEKDLHNFQGCPLYLVTISKDLVNMFIEECRTTFCYAAYILVIALRDKLNLTIVPTDEYQFSDAIKLRDLVTTIGAHISRDYMSDDVDKSLTIAYVKLVFIPPQARQLTLIKALRYIFEVKVWAFILILTLLVIITFWFSLMSGNGRYKVTKLFEAFGNMSALFFGIGISRIPKSAVMKLFLVIYVFYCIHIQTALTSNFFKLLTVPLYEHMFQTVEDVANAELPICAPLSYKVIFNFNQPESMAYSKIKRKVKLYPMNDSPNIVERAMFMEECVALLSKQDLNNATFWLKRKIYAIEDTLLATGEIIGVKTVMVMRKGHYLMVAVNELITRFVESGIFGVAERNAYEILDRYVESAAEEPADVEMLTLDQLYIFFVIYGIGCCLAVLVFALELLIHRIKQ